MRDDEDDGSGKYGKYRRYGGLTVREEREVEVEVEMEVRIGSVWGEACDKAVGQGG